MPREETDITPRIRDILLRDWDPSNASRIEAARHEYDPYIAPLAELIQSDAGEEAIIEFLHQRELETMCFPGLDHTLRLRSIARRLAALREQ